MITLFEALFILALDEEEGVLVESAAGSLSATLAGALLAELALQKRIELADSRVVVIDPTPTTHPILDRSLFDILDTARARKLKYWINTLTYHKLPEEIGHHLVKEGVLVRKKKRLRLAIPSGESQAADLSAKYALKSRLREIVLAERPPELSEKILLTMIEHGGLIKLVFTRGERKVAHKRMKKLIKGDGEVDGLGKTLDEILAVACETRG
jgi:hypothetical protein